MVFPLVSYLWPVVPELSAISPISCYIQLALLSKGCLYVRFGSLRGPMSIHMAFHRRLPWLFTLVSQLWPVVPELLRLWFRSNIIFIKRGLDFAPEGRLGSFGNRFGIHVAFHRQVWVFFCTVSRLWPVVPELLRFWFRNEMIFCFFH